MTLKEIQLRKAEIAKRMKEINEIATRAAGGEDVKENIEELNSETDKLVEERETLGMQELNIRSSVEFGEDSVVPSERNKEELVKEPLTVNSKAYRNDFMNFITRGVVGDSMKKVMMEKRSDAFTTTGDVATVIVPAVITDELFKTNKQAGSLYERVRKLSVPFGLAVKTSDTEFEIEWVAERNTSETKKGTTDQVVFTAHKGLIKFAVSLNAETTTLPEFEQAMRERMIEGAINSFDKAIVSGLGSGSNQPEGILTGANYSTGTKATKFTDATVSTPTPYITSYSKIPAKKKAGAVFVINEEDWLNKIVGMKDETGRVLAFETVGFGGIPQPVFLGKPVILLEGQGLNSYEDISAGAASAARTFAFWANLSDYYLNFNKQMTVRKYIDEETDDIITKLSLLADGKQVNKTSVVPCYKGV